MRDCAMMDIGQEIRLLQLVITPADRERGPKRMLEEAVQAVTRAYTEAIACERAVVLIDVTVRRP